MQARAHALIPGGSHTYAKGDDQYPYLSPGFIVRGQGCHVWDADGNEFIEYGMGLRAVTLGHAFGRVVEAVTRSLSLGTNFSRPGVMELEAAEALLGLFPHFDMVKFAKNGSDVTTAAVKLARAFTGRQKIAVCAEQPFFSVDDWFMGTTPLDAGIPTSISDLTLKFHYNDLASVEALFEKHPGQVAALMLEPMTTVEPAPGFLEGLKSLCERNGVLLIFDEMITGFRFHLRGAAAMFGVTPHLAAFGKGLANGFSLAALAGRRDIMERGGIRHGSDRLFLLSTTHGAETTTLAAGMETIKCYQELEVVERLHRQGKRLQAGIAEVVDRHRMSSYVGTAGRPCNLVFFTRDSDKQPSQALRALFMQELIRRGVLGPSFVVSYSHSDEDIDRTIEAVDGAVSIYARAMNDGVERHLVGDPLKPVMRRMN